MLGGNNFDISPIILLMSRPPGKAFCKSPAAGPERICCISSLMLGMAGAFVCYYAGGFAIM